MSDNNINSKDHRNRGVEVLLNSKKSKQSYPLHIVFEKLIKLFKKEFTFYFEFSLKTKNSK